MMRYERNMARWLESQGYDVTYVSNLDMHHDGTILRQHKTFLSVGHDEYWSLEMRNGVEASARRRHQSRILLRQQRVLASAIRAV